MKITRFFETTKLPSFIFALCSLLFALCSSIFTSCQQQEFEPAGSMKDTPITIASAGVAELTARAITDGKLVGTNADTPATMSVFVTGGSEEKYNATNVEWTHDGTSWTGKSTMLYEGAGSNQQIYACSPYVASATTAGTISVDVTADQTDWLVATETPLTGSSVSLTMTHALAKLVLRPSFGTDVDVNNQEITAVSVGGMYGSGTLNISDNSWSNCTVSTTEVWMDNNYELLVIPMASCESFPIVVTTKDNRHFSATIDLTDESIGGKLAAGTQYNIALQIGQNKVTIEQLSMGNLGNPFGGGWNNETDLN